MDENLETQIEELMNEGYDEETIRTIALGMFCQTPEGEWSTPDKRTGWNWAFAFQQKRIELLKEEIKKLQGKDE